MFLSTNTHDAPKKRESHHALQRALRAATRSQQMIIDRVVLRFDLARREDYGLYLNVHHAALESTKDWWRREDVGDFVAMTRRLQSDLGDLGIAISSLTPGVGRSIPDPARLGLTYVVRGSRLSAGEVRRRVSAQFATSYLDFSPKVTWGQFLSQLDAVGENRENHDRIIQGAREALAVFIDLLMHAVA